MVKLRQEGKQNRLQKFAYVLLLLVFACAFVCVPQGIVSAYDVSVFDDLDSFVLTVNEMIDVYDSDSSTSISDVIETSSSQNSTSVATTNDGNQASFQVSTLAENAENGESISENEDDEQVFNRLIVYAEEKIDDFGAVMRAQYFDLHVFQYQTREDAECAYEKFSDMNLEVSFDAIVSAEEVTIESTYETNPWDDDKDFNSWGAEYLGYETYVDNMFMTNGGQVELNDFTVVVLDSGINTTHELFEGRLDLENARDFVGVSSLNANYGTLSRDVTDENGHGTHVAGIIADATLDNVTILPIRVLDENGDGYVSYITAAIRYVNYLKNSLDVNIKVLNMSIGIDGDSSSGNLSLENSIRSLYRNDILPVISAGNSRLNTLYSSPANVEEAVVVSALMQSRDSLVFDSSYSNYGSTVDFSAPGTDIISAGISSNTSYVYMTGTSMAAPHVAACAALIYSNPLSANYTADDVYQVLVENASDLGTEGFDQYYGYGCVNVGSIGVIYSGYVNFSVTEQIHDSPFYVTLEYSEDAIGDVEIFYTTDENATSVDRLNGTQYSGERILISETTKVTAVAYISGTSDSSGYITQSYVSSQIYYINNYDLLSNFEFEDISFGSVRLVKYNGVLTTLRLPEASSNGLIVSIGEYAFNGTNVQELYLSSSVRDIEDYAFANNSTIQVVHYSSDSHSIELGTRAFYRCSALSEVDIGRITAVGEYAFTYCTNLKTLELYNAVTIGRQAFSGSGIEEVYFGKSLNSIGVQASLSIKKVYGYANEDGTSVAENFAYDYNLEFFDLTLKFKQNAPTEMVVLEGEALSFDLIISGREADYLGTYTTTQTGTLATVSIENETQISQFEKKFTVSIHNIPLGTDFGFYVVISDANGDMLSSQTVNVDVVDSSAQTFVLNFEGADEAYANNFSVFVNENIVGSGELYHQDGEYVVVVQAENGFMMNSITLNGAEQMTTPSSTFTIVLDEETVVSGEVNLVVNIYPSERLSVTFITDGLGDVVVEDTVVSSQIVDREEDVVFSVRANVGYEVRRVEVDETVLTADENGFYHLENVTSDSVVVITFELQTFNIHVSCGKGGSVSTTGSVVDSNMEYGESRTYTISTSDGYAIDFVSVNGELLNVRNNIFVLENVDENCDVVISFRKTGGIFAGNSVVFVYFMIFLVLFLIFVIAKVFLHFKRKREKQSEMKK